MYQLEDHATASLLLLLVLAVFDCEGVVLEGLADLVCDEEVNVVVDLDIDVLCFSGFS